MLVLTSQHQVGASGVVLIDISKISNIYEHFTIDIDLIQII